MSRWRRLVLAILLACLPLQAVAGATGIACAFAAHRHADVVVLSTGGAMDTHHAAARTRAAHDPHGHAVETPSGHAAATHPAPDAAHASHVHATHAAQDADGYAAHASGAHAVTPGTPAMEHDATHASAGHAGSDTCRFCMECCASAAPVPTIDEIRSGPTRILRLSGLASPLHASQSGDTLFRPPRPDAA